MARLITRVHSLEYVTKVKNQSVGLARLDNIVREMVNTFGYTVRSQVKGGAVLNCKVHDDDCYMIALRKRS